MFEVHLQSDGLTESLPLPEVAAPRAFPSGLRQTRKINDLLRAPLTLAAKMTDYSGNSLGVVS